MKTLVLVDSQYVLFRSHFATPFLTNAGMYGYLKTVKSFRDYYNNPDFVLVWDVGQSWRSNVYPQYKANRPFVKGLEDVTAQKKDLLEASCLPTFYVEGYEADDVIAQYVFQCSEHYDLTVIVSNDSDLYQLLNDTVVLHKSVQEEPLTHAKVCEMFPPLNDLRTQWPVVKAIAGDRSDNIEGVPRYGLKRAASLFKDADKLRQVIEEYRDIIERNLQLVTLSIIPDFQLRLPAKISTVEWDALCMRYNMPSLLAGYDYLVEA